MKRSEAFPSKYLSKEDVDPARIGTINGLKRETLKSDDGDETKTVMYFREEALKPMILNNTNWMIAEEAYGEDSDAWVGKKIELYLDPNVMFGAKRVGGVRVRIPSAATAAGLPEVWPIDRAKVELEKNGLDIEALKAALIAKGFVTDKGGASYSPARDTELVQKLITDALATPTEIA